MASLRSRTDSSAQPGRPGSRNARVFVESSDEEFAINASNPSRFGIKQSRLPNQTIPQPKGSSRIPQGVSFRRPSNEQTSRPPLTHQTQPWAFMSGANPARSMTYPKPSSLNDVAASRTLNQQQPRKVLRRKQSGLSHAPASLRADSRNESSRTSSSLSDPRSQTSFDAASPDMYYDRGLTESPLEIRVAQKLELPVTTAHTVTIYPELDRYRDAKPRTPSEDQGGNLPYRIATHDLPPPTPLFSEISAFSGSPSTRFSGSPGPGPYSRDTTPTSISSQSPGLVAPARISATRARQASGETQTRPPVTRRRAGSMSNEGDSLGADPHGLSAVRESLTSSSSNSTVQDGERKSKERYKKKTRLSPLPPSPPPRKSSQKFAKSRDEDESPSKVSRAPAQPIMTPPSPASTTPFSHARQSPRSMQPSQAVSPSDIPPVRPSRDGAPDLQSQLGFPVPVVHSNLSSTSLSERRYSQAAVLPSTGRPVTPSSLQDQRQPPTRLPLGREPTPAPTATIPHQARSQVKPEPVRSTRTPSPGISTFKTRFPLFGRRAKTNTEGAQADKQEKTTRKGPAAGTGHEGYGRLGAVRRRSSGIAKGMGVTASSQESLSSNQSYDPFFADRMAPVIIAGGEVIENRNNSSEISRTDSNISIPYSRPAESRNGSQLSLSSREGTRQTLWPSPFPRDASRAPSSASRRPSDSSDSEALAMKSTLAYRRSMQRMKATDQPVPRIPRPINTRTEVVSPAVTSIDESIMSDDSMAVPRPKLGRGRRESDASSSPGPKKLTKRARSPRKWNLFGRSHSQATQTPPKAANDDTAKTVSATVKAVQQKPVAFYTLMDSSEQEDAEPLDIKDVVREARAPDVSHLPSTAETGRKPSITQLSSDETRPSGTQQSSRDRKPSLSRPSSRGRQNSVATNSTNSRQLSQRRSVTSPEIASPQPGLSSSEPGPAAQVPALRQGLGRPSRLPQVGRIPKVVSARPDQASPKSFSRPFHRISVQIEPPKPTSQDPDSLAKGPTPPRTSTPELTQDESTATSGTNPSEVGASQPWEFSPEAGRVSREFLSFSPRKNSLGTITTSCSSCSGRLTYADATAIVPAPNAPLVEDEIWDEYNDLIGGDNLLKMPPSVGATVAKVFGRRDLTVALGKPSEAPLESPTINLPVPAQSLSQILQPIKEQPTSSIYSADMAEKIKDSLEAGPNPSSPFSLSKFVDGYGDRNNSVDLGKDSGTSKQTGAAAAAAARRSDASGSSQGSDDNSPLSQVNLRVGSMTVSKWLTFGHVLFSPVREQLSEIIEGSLKRKSILVIDGLGNDDWSFYAAETYPAATFFNLSPRAPLPADHQSSSSFPLSPSNHHQVQYTGLGGKFPFGQESFTSVVFRFPVTAPEAHYRNVISEARRVLKPGGFVELAILDVDFNNMGNHGRRAVRRLKERIHARSPDTSLGSTSDLILRLLGRKGFIDIKTCRVGVPVASGLARSSGSEYGVGGGAKPSSPGKSRIKPKRDERSLAEMMSDESPLADENITKMVARVGRWWYSRCYETAAVVAPGALSKASLWNDRALLAECEEWGTSLKLMVCHARVPDGRGRLASI